MALRYAGFHLTLRKQGLNLILGYPGFYLTLLALI